MWLQASARPLVPPTTEPMPDTLRMPRALGELPEPLMPWFSISTATPSTRSWRSIASMPSSPWMMACLDGSVKAEARFGLSVGRAVVGSVSLAAATSVSIARVPATVLRGMPRLPRRPGSTVTPACISTMAGRSTSVNMAASTVVWIRLPAWPAVPARKSRWAFMARPCRPENMMSGGMNTPSASRPMAWPMARLTSRS